MKLFRKIDFFLKDGFPYSKDDFGGQLCFVLLKYQNLHAFIGVKFGLKISLRVKDLTFCNSGNSLNSILHKS